MGCTPCHYVIADNGCCQPNHVFDPKMNSFYGGDNHCFFDADTTRNSNCTPGLSTGLYRPCGPLNVCLCSCVNTTLTSVSAKAKITLLVTFNYANEKQNQTIEIIPGNIYTLSYIEDGVLKQCTGMVKDIYKVVSTNNETLYKISIDCSANYTNQVVIIKTDQLRSIRNYTPYAEEDSTISNSVQRYGTTLAATISKCIITNGVIDKNGNITDGIIIAGEIDGYTTDGIAQGINSSNHEIVVINGKTLNGSITEGRILNAILRSGDVDGMKDDQTGIVEKATIKGIISNVVAINTVVTGGKTSDGKVINPVLEGSYVTDAIITGDDMITTGGITCGNITTGGTTTGGTATGGTATGNIDGNRYVIEGGVTTGDLVTTGGVVTGGTIIGGTHIGAAIIGATIKGGVVSGGLTTGGTTTGGTFTTTKSHDAAIGKNVENTYLENPDYSPRIFNPPIENTGKDDSRNTLIAYGINDVGGINVRFNTSERMAKDLYEERKD